MKSTVPIGTNDRIEEFLKENLVKNVGDVKEYQELVMKKMIMPQY